MPQLPAGDRIPSNSLKYLQVIFKYCLGGGEVFTCQSREIWALSLADCKHMRSLNHALSWDSLKERPLLFPSFLRWSQGRLWHWSPIPSNKVCHPHLMQWCSPYFCHPCVWERGGEKNRTTGESDHSPTGSNEHTLQDSTFITGLELLHSRRSTRFHLTVSKSLTPPSEPWVVECKQTTR